MTLLPRSAGFTCSAMQPLGALQANFAVCLCLQAVPLADMMLGCLGHSEQSVADAALEYISCLDYVPMTDRSPQLQVCPCWSYVGACSPPHSGRCN